ncbi:MAG TPA: sulfotransferase family 2 domain-containing protein [Saprospiraceae bacterium]|nr:sulfotransferase family 2 domain-containing protein [Saprospiraceae bacterium]
MKPIHEEFFIKGKEAFQNKEFNKTIIIFQNLISDGFESPEVLNLLAHSFMYTNNHHEAERSFHRLNVKYPNTLFGIIGLASLKLNQDLPDDCMNIMADALKENPHHQGIINLQIQALYKKKSYRKVIDWYERTIAICNENKTHPPSIVLHYAGLSYEWCGEPGKAKQIFDDLIQQHPKHYLGYIDLAKFYENTGMYNQALQIWSYAYEHFPKINEIIIRYTSMLNRYGYLRESTNILKGSYSLVYQNHVLCKKLIYNQILLQDWNGLVDDIKSIIKGNYINNPTNLLDILIENLMKYQALDHFTSIWVEDIELSGNPFFSYFQAIINYCEGHFGKALKNIEQYFHTENGILNDINALKLKYKILLHSDKVKAADQSYEGYLKERNIHFKIFLDYALHCYKRSLPEPSIANIEKAYSLAPNDPGVIYHQFLIYYHFKGIKKALEFLQTQSHKSQKLSGIYLQELIYRDEFSKALDHMVGEEKDLSLSWNIIFDIYSYCKAQGKFANAVILLNSFYKKPVLTREDLVFKVRLAQEARHLMSLLQNKKWVYFTPAMANKKVRAEIFRSLRNILKDEGNTLKPHSNNPIPFLHDISEGKITDEFVKEYFQAFYELSIQCRRFYPDTYTDITSAFHIGSYLRRRIKKRIPTVFLSFRVTDGIFLELMNRENKENHHFTFLSKDLLISNTDPLNREELEDLLHTYMHALEAADILGIPHWSSVLKAIWEFRTESPLNDNVGLLNIYRNISTQLKNVKMKKWGIITNSELIPHFNYYQLLPFILDSVDKCYVISSKPEIVDYLKLNLDIPEVEWLEVPEKLICSRNQFDSENNEFHIGLLENIEQITRNNKGLIFLVSAGIRGKIYCQKIKESGSIALEIGSISDFWSGQDNRYGYEHPVPPLGVTFSYPEVLKWRINFKEFPIDFWKEKIRNPEKLAVQKIYFFIKFGSVAFTTDRNDNRFTEWEYQTFFLVYNCPMPGTIEYEVISSAITFHKIIPAHQNTEEIPLFKFYAYPKRHTESHIQKLRFSNVPYGKQINIEEIITYPLYPVCEVTHLNEITIHENRAFKNQNIIPAISIVMAYKNRKTQLAFTLNTIESSHYPKDQIEVVIADDGSHESECILSLIEKFSFPIVLIRITDEYKREKNYINPCIPYNKAFKMARGESIIIQNPEVCHIGEVLNFVEKHINENEFLSFTCAQLHRSSFNEMVQNLYGANGNQKQKSVRPFIAQKAVELKNSIALWYNHPTFRAKAFHFLCAIHNDNLTKLEGFREEFAFGIGVDDIEFAYRIKHDLNLNVRFTNWKSEPFGIHQWHASAIPQNQGHKHLINRNQRLFSRIISQKVLMRQSYSMKSDAHKVVVYTYPKSGITTVRSWFLVLLGKYTFDEVMDINPHVFNWMAFEDDHPSSTSDYEKILVFRNPKDRFVSMYTSLFETDYYEKHIFKRTMQEVHSMTHLIEMLYTELSSGAHNLLKDEHIAPQFLFPPNVNFDKIFTTDQIQKFLEYANVKFNTSFPYTTKRNESNSRNRHKVEQEFNNLTKSQIEKFKKIYKNDLDFYELISN